MAASEIIIIAESPSPPDYGATFLSLVILGALHVLNSFHGRQSHLVFDAKW